MLIHVNSRRIYYDLVGDKGAPVIYLAHALAADSGMWALQVPALLAAGYRVLRADMRGHGGSDATPGDYSMQMLAGDVVTLLDELALDRVHFCGLSIGGMVGLTLGLFHPERLSSLILSNTRSHSPADGQKRWGPRIAEVQKARSMQPLALSTMQRWLTEEGRRANPGLWTQIHDTIAANSVEGYAGCTAAILNFDWRPRLGEIAAPTLVLCGTDDQGSDASDNEQVARQVKQGKYVGIEGARHLANVESPKLFNTCVIDWCKRHQAP